MVGEIENPILFQDDNKVPKVELSAGQQIEEINSSKRVYYPTPLFCHSNYVKKAISEGRLRFGQYGPNILVHVASYRPVIVNDYMPDVDGLYDRMTEAAAWNFARQIIQNSLNAALDTHSPKDGCNDQQNLDI